MWHRPKRGRKLTSIHAPTPPPPLHRSLQAVNTIRSQPTGRFYLGLLPAPPACTSMSLRTYSHQLAALDAKAVKAWLQGASWLRRANKDNYLPSTTPPLPRDDPPPLPRTSTTPHLYPFPRHTHAFPL